MIAKQSIGLSFTRTLNYNLKRMQSANAKEWAELLATNFSSMEKQKILKELAMMKALNPKLRRHTWHTSLNFAQGELISKDKMKAPNKDELEMIVRAGKPSHKLLLQQKVRDAIKHSKSMDQFINHLERHGVMCFSTRPARAG